MLRRLFIAALGLILVSLAASAQQFPPNPVTPEYWNGSAWVPISPTAPLPIAPKPTNGASFTDPSTNVGASAGNLTFAHTPSAYLSFCNEAAAGGGYISISDAGTAVLNAQPSHTIWPGGCLIYENSYVPTGVTWSAIASIASTPLRVEYK